MKKTKQIPNKTPNVLFSPLRHRRAIPTYIEKMTDFIGSNMAAFWRLNEPSGTTAIESIHTANGLHGGAIVLADSLSPDGQPCPLYTGTCYTKTDQANQINSYFNGHEGSMGGWAKVTDLGFWTDGAYHTTMQLYGDASNRIYMTKETTNYWMTFYYISAGTSRKATYFMADVGWFHWLVTWSESNNRWSVYINGAVIFTGKISVTASTIPDTDASITYSGTWYTQTITGASGGTVHYTMTPGNLAQISLSGTQFSFLYSRGPDRGLADIYIDGIFVSRLDMYALAVMPAQVYISPICIDGTHTIQVICISGRLDVDAFTIETPKTWSASSLNANSCAIGSMAATGSYCWSGWLADHFMANRELNLAEARTAATLLNPMPRITIIGDSIAAYATSWPQVFQGVYKDGLFGLSNHAVGGQSVLLHMYIQAFNSKYDDADIIILALGSNDNGGGTAIYNIIVNTITFLRTTNPRAVIYYLNVLPRWQNVNGDNLFDHSAIRGTIKDACAATNVTCWDSYTDPWWLPSDTLDGTHPNASGAAKISAAVAARLP